MSFGFDRTPDPMAQHYPAVIYAESPMPFGFDRFPDEPKPEFIGKTILAVSNAFRLRPHSRRWKPDSPTTTCSFRLQCLSASTAFPTAGLLTHCGAECKHGQKSKVGYGDIFSNLGPCHRTTCFSFNYHNSSSLRFRSKLPPFSSLGRFDLVYKNCLSGPDFSSKTSGDDISSASGDTKARS